MEVIRNISDFDIQQITDIYNFYVKNTVISFETEPILVEDMRSRVMAVQKSCLPWIVMVVEDQVVGFAYACDWKSRCAYKKSKEISVYFHSDFQGKGLGTKLYQFLFDQMRILNIHTLIAGIALPNEASVHLHEKFGFKKVAHFEQVGHKFGRFIDVGYWQLIL